MKIVGGLVTGSSGLVADGFHSVTDVVSMSVNYCTMRMSLKPAQGLQAYENYKKEILGTLFVSCVLFLIGLVILVRSYIRLLSGVQRCPGLGSILIVVVAFAVTYWLYRYSRNHSCTSASFALAVNTEQIRLNVLSTAAVLVGIAGSFLDMNYLDVLAALAVALIILYSSVKLVFDLVHEAKGARLSGAQVAMLKKLVRESVPDSQIVKIRTMMVRKKIWLFLVLLGREDKPIIHPLTNRLKQRLLSELPFLDNVIVGINLTPPLRPSTIEVDNLGNELKLAKNYVSLGVMICLVLVISASALGFSLISREYRTLMPANAQNTLVLPSSTLARAPYFYIYRTDTGEGHFVKNPLVNHQGHLDHEIVKLFKHWCIEGVITSNVGPYVFEHLTKQGMILYSMDKDQPIAVNIQQLRTGNLDRVVKPTVNVKFGLRNFRFLKPWYNWQRQ